MTHALHVRVAAAQAVHDRFLNKPLVWGKDDCARMAADIARRLGRKPALLKYGTYSDELGALRALRKLGFNTIAEAVDSYGLPRIAPAMMLAGDLMCLDSDAPLGALVMAIGNGRVLGWSEDTGTCVALQPTKFGTAWRL